MIEFFGLKCLRLFGVNICNIFESGIFFVGKWELGFRIY